MNERDLFIAAVQIADPKERSDYLEQACGADAELRRRVEVLLRAYTQAGSFLQQPARGVIDTAQGDRDGTTATDDPTPAADTLIGPYRLLQPLGEGGMGTVFLAEQTRPVLRRVALKVIKPGMDSRLVVARFEAERQALAMMDHVNISRVFDGGATESGRPYFVMELVPGVPITTYCDDHRLSLRDRLQLFIPVCQAIQHAHQKGILHRDVKPSNVLVTLYDGKPVPKVIDFGVAKSIGERPGEHTQFTRPGHLVGTLEYMSPEQTETETLDVDTRSDIYALGVLLYELLTGDTPLTHKRVREASYLEVLRILKQEEPPRPSVRLSDSGEALRAIAAVRRTEPAGLTRAVRGELDWIVMKALEKDRDRRYETANALAQDVRRYLADEPVLAGPPSAGYRMQKFARRHRHVLGAALAFVLLLTAAVVGLSLALVAVNRERGEKVAALELEAKRRRQARSALDTMSSQIIEDWLARQRVLSSEHRQFLEQALRDYEEFAADAGQDEEARSGVASAYRRVGVIRRLLGQRQEAEVAFEEGRQRYARLVADFPGVPAYREGVARTCVGLSGLSSDRSRTPAALAKLEQGLTIYRELADEFPDNSTYQQGLARTLNRHGILLKNLHRFREAEAVYRQALVIQTRLADDFPDRPGYREELAQSYLNLGILLDLDDRPQEAESAHVRSVEIYQQLTGQDPTVALYRQWLAVSQNNLGDHLRAVGREKEAEAMFRQTLKTQRELIEEYPAVPEYRRSLAMTLNNLGILLKDSGRAEQAEEFYGQAVEIHKQLADRFPAITNHQNEAAGAMINLARLLLARKDFHGARRLLEEAVPRHRAALGANPDHPTYRKYYRLNRWRMAETLLELHDHAGAADAVREFRQFTTEPPRDAYTAACLLAGCVRLASQDEHLDEPRRKELADDYGNSAMAALREAVDKQAKELSELPTDPDLDPLRSRPDFQTLLAGLEANKQT